MEETGGLSLESQLVLRVILELVDKCQSLEELEKSVKEILEASQDTSDYEEEEEEEEEDDEEEEDVGITGKEEIRLIEYLKSQGWTADQILELIKYVRE